MKSVEMYKKKFLNVEIYFNKSEKKRLLIVFGQNCMFNINDLIIKCFLNMD